MKKNTLNRNRVRAKTKTANPQRRTRRKRRKTKAPPSAAPLKPLGFDEVPADHGGFVSLLLRRLSWADLNALAQRRHPAGCPCHELSRAQLLVGLLFHYTVSCAGSFAKHLLLLGLVVAESTLSERRQALPFAVIEDLLRLVLRPLTQVSPAAYYGGLRLVAMDGITFSLPNTPAIQRRCRKGGNQKGRNPFAKLAAAALVELAMHNPLAARLGVQGESEWRLAQGLLAHLPEQCLLLADRLYGCGAFLLAAQTALSARQGYFLVRVKMGLKIVRPLQRLPDGSRLVLIQALDPQDYHRVTGTLVVREIRAVLRRRGERDLHERFWTSLLDPVAAPAPELVRLYMRRWEQELYFRELKYELGINDLLRSQTVETAAQEVAAMIIGSALVAAERATLRPGEELSHRISFRKTWETLEPLWLTLLLCSDLLTKKQIQAVIARFYWYAGQQIMAPQRSRSCPRVLRQRTQPWPRKTNQPSYTGPLEVTIVATSS